MSTKAKSSVLAASFLALLFDGFELGLMPVASLSVSKSLLGESFTKELGGAWFAWFAASLMFGAAIGGIFLGNLGDRIGRAKAMGVCILIYSVFAGLGALAQTQEQMLLLRFLVGLGVGGLWPNGMALVAECWPGASKPLVSGVMMAGLNVGILSLSLLIQTKPITADSWRWIFLVATIPAVLGLLVLFLLPESPKWLMAKANSQFSDSSSKPELRKLFQGDLLRVTLIGILISCVPMVGAWSASKWMIPWAESVAGSNASYKAATQGWWALGAVLGSLAGAQLCSFLGRKLSYFLISIAAFAITWSMFQLTKPLEPSFHPVVFVQGLVGTLFFGWLALSLPELFSTQLRASGSGLCYNSGRFATAAGVLFAGFILKFLGGDYAKVGAICATIYAAGTIVIWFAPDESTQKD
ncbi:MAG: MFS transporter [Pirellulales bacterium]